MVRARDLDTVAPDEVINVPKIEKIKMSNIIMTEKKAETVTETVNKKVIKEQVNTDLVALRQKIYDLLGKTKHPLSSFLVRPKVFNFQERDEQEEIILVMRPHWFTNVSWAITAIFMLIFPSLIPYIPVWSDVPFRYQFLGILFWYMVTLAFALEKFLSWYFDVYIITDERVIDIQFDNLLDKKFSEASISMIQDVSSRVAGVSQTLLNYGDVRIQTAAEIPEIQFEKVPNPDKVIKVLQIMRQEEEQETIDGRVR